MIKGLKETMFILFFWGFDDLIISDRLQKLICSFNWKKICKKNFFAILELIKWYNYLINDRNFIIIFSFIHH